MKEDTTKPTEAEKPAVAEAAEAAPKEAETNTAPAAKKGGKPPVAVLAIIGVVVVLAIAGYFTMGKKTKTATVKIGDTTVKTTTKSDGTQVTEYKDGSGNTSTTTTTSNGTTTTELAEQKLPTDFPTAKVPLYADQKIVGSYKSKQNGDNYWYITATTSDSVSKVVDKLKSQYSSWESTSELESDGTFVLAYKKDTLITSLSISSADNKTTVVYSVTESSTAQ